ncbi:hypothetical protein I4U23_004256 [Adineta vaga]|nr:hypothetical protein I4U23_004256 [Adineta vaga]
MKIFVKTSIGMGRTYEFDVEPRTTMKEFKKKFLIKIKVENNIYYNLSGYNIENESVLEMVYLNNNKSILVITMGKKQIKDKASEICSSDWQHAGDAYHYFDEQTNGIVQWKQLMIETVKNRPS